MQTKYTEADFDSRFWESCAVWRVTVPFSNPFGTADSELMLDMDYMEEPFPNGTYLHSPATLQFHGITDLNINFGSGDSGFQDAPSGFLIERINRKLLQNQKVFLDRPYYSWSVELVSPPSQSGYMTFGAYGFTFRVGEAVLSKSLF